MDIFGDILSEEYNVEEIQKILKRNIIKPRFRISILNPDETINYEIPPEDIPNGGISYTEDYQSGQRRSLTLRLINKSGKYTPSINGIWLTTKFRFDVGIEYQNSIIWFPKGVYIMGDVTLTHQNSNNEVEIQLNDKFAIYEGKMGTLESGYEIGVNSTVSDVVKGLMNTSSGDGYVFDYKDAVFDPTLVDFLTQTTIRIEEGGTLSQVIQELGTQLSAEYYFNTLGNLCFYPINSTTDDSSKPIIWTFPKLNRELHDFSLSYKNSEVYNCCTVVGDNVDGKIYSATVENTNPASPICIQRIGRRAPQRYNESSVWSDETAQDMAKYYLRQSSFVNVDFSCNCAFNPLLTVNNLVEVEDEFLGYNRVKLLITSVSYSSEDGLMNLKLCATSDLPY